MRLFKSTHEVQRFLGVNAAVYKLCSLGRHLVSAEHYRNLWRNAFICWTEIVVLHHKAAGLYIGCEFNSPVRIVRILDFSGVNYWSEKSSFIRINNYFR